MEQKTYDQVKQALDFLQSVAYEQYSDKPDAFFHDFRFSLWRIGDMLDVHWGFDSNNSVSFEKTGVANV